MENGILTETQQKDADLIELLLEKVVKKKGFENICANADGYDTPAKIRRSKDTEEYFIPDCTGGVKTLQIAEAVWSKLPKQFVILWKIEN